MKFDLVGLNKGSDCASTVILNTGSLDFQIHLKERISRIKHGGDPFLLTLDRLRREGLLVKKFRAAETSFYFNPTEFEAQIEIGAGFSDYLKKMNLENASRLTNPQVDFISHHLAHARAASWVSPFQKSIVLVMDGLGSRYEDCSYDLSTARLNRNRQGDGSRDARHRFESVSVYLQNGVELTCVEKEFQFFDRVTGEIKDVSIGQLFEIAAEMIFGSRYDAGKVMGLAAYGRAAHVRSHDELFRTIRKKLPSRGYSGRILWESSKWRTYYANLAATVQRCFEAVVQKRVSGLHRRYPNYENLILTGGCALNCVSNARLSRQAQFKRIYTPPFPGDEGVGLGAALESLVRSGRPKWKPTPNNRQMAFFGPERKPATKAQLKELFPEFEIFPRDAHRTTLVDCIVNGKIVAVFEGSSESGPRALGHRSLLATPLRSGIKDYLNFAIKSREAFRPFGVVCLLDKAAKYFLIDHRQQSPFMDFAPKIRSEYRRILVEVAHVDGTCRIQTICRQQNEWLFRLIEMTEKKNGVGCLINTSLNVMGEPLVESIFDLRNFVTKVPIDHMIVDRWFLVRKITRSKNNRRTKKSSNVPHKSKASVAP